MFFYFTSILEGPKIHQPKFLNNESTVFPVVKNEQSIFELNPGYVTHGVQLLSYISELNKIKDTRERSLPLPSLPSLTAPNTCPISQTPFSHLGTYISLIFKSIFIIYIKFFLRFFFLKCIIISRITGNINKSNTITMSTRIHQSQTSSFLFKKICGKKIILKILF